MYSEIDLHPYVDFEALAKAIINQTTATSITLVKSSHDYRVFSCILASDFQIHLSEELLREAMNSKRRVQ